MARAVNSDVYADGAPELAPVDLWPAPVGGFKLRHYPLAQYLDPKGDRYSASMLPLDQHDG